MLSRKQPISISVYFTNRIAKIWRHKTKKKCGPASREVCGHVGTSRLLTHSFSKDDKVPGLWQVISQALRAGRGTG